MLEFQYFDGCPNAMETLKNLNELIEEEFKGIDFTVTEIKDSNDAEKLNFQGSPTILYNDFDIYTGKKPESYNYTCRIYNIDGKSTGVLSKDYIRTKLIEYLK